MPTVVADHQTLTRREKHRHATHAEIVTAARRLLAGGHEISLRAVADQLGMTPPGLYRYVASHAALLDLAVQASTGDMIAAMQQARDTHPEDDPGARAPRRRRAPRPRHRRRHRRQLRRPPAARHSHRRPGIDRRSPRATTRPDDHAAATVRDMVDDLALEGEWPRLDALQRSASPGEAPNQGHATPCGNGADSSQRGPVSADSPDTPTAI